MALFTEFSKKRNTFGLKFFVLFTVFTACVALSFTLLFFHSQRRVLEENMTGEGHLLARLLAHSVRLGVFTENSELLKDPIEGILSHEGVLFVSILSGEGNLLREQPSSSMLNTPERGFPHWSTRFEQIRRSQASPVFEGDTFYEFWSPVASTPQLASTESLYLAGPSHETAKIIGFVRIIVDKEPLRKKLEALLAKSISLALLFLALGTIIIYAIVQRITQPLNRLTEGLQKLERGETFEPLRVESKDEVGRLAAAFNHLVETLRTREAEKECLAEELRHAQKMEAVGTLAGGVAHDFNNILTAIVGFGTLLQRSLKNDNPFRIYVDQILIASDRATTLVKRLLAFGRKQVINPKPANLNDIVKSIEKLLARLISEDIDFRLVLVDEPLICQVDTGQIDQILINLVTNARDAMPGGGSLTITTGSEYLDEDFFSPIEKGKPGRYGVISIADSGMGMDEQTKERIFDPFFTTKEVGKGTGLGLSMAYGIIKQHEGFVAVESFPDEGTTFRVYLPLVQTAATADSPERLHVQRGNRETILVAEDDKAVRKLARHVLERSGYEVIEAVDGTEAVRRFQEYANRIDMVLLDVVMPKKNGQAAYEEMKLANPNLRALYISGYTQDIINRKGVLDEGINFIAKPVKPDELLAKVQEVLRQ
ncbi:histidine kinase [Geobacter pickeringii]|uniref:histidine kinase n=2 Tax=Geobacter pickeringii TaxID=345632 RepID=A0A0B5BD05_9BACT|nr:histidine kinase [Geobacter pickeringii]